MYSIKVDKYSSVLFKKIDGYNRNAEFKGVLGWRSRLLEEFLKKLCKISIHT